MTSRLTLFATAPTCILLAACASPSTDYPSLEIRESERYAQSPPERPAPTPAEPVPAATMARVATLASTAARFNRSFAARAPAVTRIVSSARGAAIGSDRWASGQIAISELDSLRASTARALADIDVIYAERGAELGSRAEIGEARQDVVAMIEQQDTVLVRLKGQLRQ